MNNISIHSIDTVCLKEACPVHHLCARFERYQKLRKSEKVFSILNPDRIACNEQGCAYRLQKKIIRMARGFRRMFGTIPSANTPSFLALFALYQRKHLLQGEARRHPHRTRYAAEITASFRTEWRRYQHRF